MNEFAVSCGSDHIYWRYPSWKTLFFVKCHSFKINKDYQRLIQNPIKHLRWSVLFTPAPSLLSKNLIQQCHSEIMQKQISLFPGHFFAHCVKSVQIRSFFWSVFSRILTEYGEIQMLLYTSVIPKNSGD